MTVSPLKIKSTYHLPLALLLIVAVTLAVYWTVLDNAFISYDDTDYVTGNMMVRQGLTAPGFIWAFSAFHAGNWHPLTWLSHMLDVSLFNLDPRGHHASALLFHTLNATILCALLHRLTGLLGRSLVVALLFALHPLHVESVAWIAERKDVLSTLFWLLTMWSYALFAEKPTVKRYLPVLCCFAFGLLAKQMLVTLPFILLLMDYWPLPHRTPSLDKKSLINLLSEKIPFFVMAAVAAAVTIRAQASAGAIARGEGNSLFASAGNAFISYLTYIQNMCWPTRLAIFYPFEPERITPLKAMSAVTLLALASFIIIVQRKKRPYLLFGWFWYLITLLPVIGFLRIGGQAFADRYTYIPLIGLFVMLVWLCADMAASLRHGSRIIAGITVVICVLLSLLTNKQIGYWKTSYELYSHALNVVDRNWLAHNNIGILLSQSGRNEAAMAHFRQSVALNPKGSEGYRNLGNALQMAGRDREALDAFVIATSINPVDTESLFRLGYAYLFSGDIERAQQEYVRLLPLDRVRAEALLASISAMGHH